MRVSPSGIRQKPNPAARSPPSAGQIPEGARSRGRNHLVVATAGDPPSARGERPATVDHKRLPADHLGVRRAEERDDARDVLRRDELAGRVAGAGREHLLPVREVLERAGLDDAGGDRVDADAERRELDREVADERLERGLRGADERVVVEYADGPEARDAD